MTVKIVDTADVSPQAQIGDGTSVWHLSQIRENAVVGENCVIGRASYIGEGAEVGNNCKIQNLAQIYEPAKLEDGVFIGPAVVLTNDQYPRAINPDGSAKSASDWESVGVTIRKGAAIGARSVLVAPLEVGEWALVAAGSTVIRDVPAFALVVGSPARQIGWVGKQGHRLIATDEDTKILRCPVSGDLYIEKENGTIEEIS